MRCRTMRRADDDQDDEETKHTGRSTKWDKAGMTKWAEVDEQAQDEDRHRHAKAGRSRQAGRPP